MQISESSAFSLIGVDSVRCGPLNSSPVAQLLHGDVCVRNALASPWAYSKFHKASLTVTQNLSSLRGIKPLNLALTWSMN
jgi:hypothetical protein